MAGLEIKSVKSPEERRPFKDKGSVAVVNVSGHPVLYGTFEPGWKWSVHVKPIAGTESCQAPHLLHCISGRMGHDAWTVGNEPCIAVDFGGFSQYAQRR